MLRERMSDGPVLPKKLSQQPSSLVTPRLRARAALRPTTQAQNIRPKCYNKPWRQDSGPLRIQRIDSASQKTSEFNFTFFLQAASCVWFIFVLT